MTQARRRSRLPPTGFQVTFRDTPIFEWSTPRSGIKYGNPEVEWILAANWAGYRYFDDWQELPGEHKSMLIAAYRIQNQSEAVIAKYSRKKPKK